MKLSHKIKKAFRPRMYAPVVKALAWPADTYQQRVAERRAQKIALRTASLTVEDILQNVDRTALAHIRQRYSDAGDHPNVFWTKYLDCQKWLTLNIRYAHELGLVTNPPRRVLDLGCGGGYFLAVCRHLGAEVLGLDLDRDLVLNEMIALFHLRRVAWRIRPLVKLPALGKKFDLITAWMVCFNLSNKRSPWTAAEWAFFLDDVTGRLRPRGKVILSLNKQLDDGKLYNEEVGEFFKSRGALIEGKRLTFTRADLVRTGGLLRREPAR